MYCYYGISGTYAVLFFIHYWQLGSFYHHSQKNVKKVDAEQVLMRSFLRSTLWCWTRLQNDYQRIFGYFGQVNCHFIAPGHLVMNPKLQLWCSWQEVIAKMRTNVKTPLTRNSFWTGGNVNRMFSEHLDELKEQPEQHVNFHILYRD